MPLRFRAVVPYTLPGVLALIGCWWYLSRKKQRSVTHEGPEGTPATATGLKAPSVEGSNGLLEVAPACTDQRSEGGSIPRNVGAAIPVERIPDDVPEERRKREGILSKEFDHGDPERRSSPELDIKDALAAEEEEPSECRPAPVGPAPSEAERPEPEGEVAVLSEVAALMCALTPPKAEKEEEGGALEATPTPQEFTQNLVSSTPTFAAGPEDAHAEEAEPDLELLASGLITEVISAATQEVLGRPEQLRLPPGPAHNGCEGAETEEEEAGTPNGCPPPKPQANGAQEPRADEASVLAEDSACSTCHSEDGASGEDVRTEQEGVQGIAGAAGDDGAADDLKRLNGLSLRNGGVGNEAETDQSGGETTAEA